MEPGVTFTVGLEVHVRLATGHKLFCPCAYHFAAPANSLVCPVCLGLPGSLPVLDLRAVDLALRVGLALGCEIQTVSEFDRKNYFYPDLPRNYQITQFRRPLLTGGQLEVPGGASIPLRRIHLEEDAGRSLERSAPAERQGLIDANRAGTPLLEIVTEPRFSSGEEARRWLGHLRQILLYLEVNDGKMEQGSLRCDANVGLSDAGSLVEIKNLNSFKSVARAVDAEIARLSSLVRQGLRPKPETRSWEPALRRTAFLRSKEAHRDYRFFPEPDLPPLVIQADRRQAAAARIPELPGPKQQRLKQQWGINAETAGTVCADPRKASWAEETARLLAEAGIPHGKAGLLGANWVAGPVAAAVDDVGWERLDQRIGPARLAALLELLHGGNITGQVAREIFQGLLAGRWDQNPASIVEQEGWAVEHDEGRLNSWIEAVLAENPRQVEQYQAGKEALLDFFVGMAMRRGQGRGSPERLRDLIRQHLADRPRT